MNSFSEMVLISKAEYDMLIGDKKPIETGPESAVKSAEKKCHDIIKSDSYPDDVKNAFYQDAMKNLILKRRQRENSVAKHEPTKKLKTGPTRSWETRICNSVPQRFKTRARCLWTVLSNSSSPVFLSDSGEIEISGSMIPSSNIIDLVGHAVRDSSGSSGGPVGWESFLDMLRKPELNLPLSAVGKSVRRLLSDETEKSETSKETVKGMGDRFVWQRLKMTT